jgi:hypothetical protein
MSDPCGKWMPRKQAPCAHTAGHNGFCADASSIEARRAYAKAWRIKNPESGKASAVKYRTAPENVKHRRVHDAVRRQRPAVQARESARRKKHDADVKSWLAGIKLTSGCVDCGYRAHHVALDFDHLPEFEKLFDISRALWRPRKTLGAEIAKCEVVCSNCHRIRTYERANADEKT